MYYLSRIRISQASMMSGRIQGRFMGSVYGEHKLVWSFFDSDSTAQRDFLFRRFDLGEQTQYFILSERKPVDRDEFWEIETKEYQPVLHDGMRFSFNLRVNPTITKKTEGNESKKRTRNDVYMEALARNKELSEEKRQTNKEVLTECGTGWLMRRSESLGFCVQPQQIMVEGYQKLTGSKDRAGHKIQIGTLDFSGILTVKNQDLFQETVFHGIGHSKSFGCGLLLLKRI